MATIANRKKEPLSISQVNDLFKGSYGVKVEEYSKGTALISHLLDPQKKWWVDVTPLEGVTPLTIREISTALNKQIPDRKAYFGAR